MLVADRPAGGAAGTPQRSGSPRPDRSGDSWATARATLPGWAPPPSTDPDCNFARAGTTCFGRGPDMISRPSSALGWTHDYGRLAYSGYRRWRTHRGTCPRVDFGSPCPLDVAVHDVCLVAYKAGFMCTDRIEEQPAPDKCRGQARRWNPRSKPAGQPPDRGWPRAWQMAGSVPEWLCSSDRPTARLGPRTTGGGRDSFGSPADRAWHIQYSWAWGPRSSLPGHERLAPRPG